MLDLDYINSLPKNKIMAADKICSNFVGEKLNEDPRDIVYTLEVLLDDDTPSSNKFIPSGTIGDVFKVLSGSYKDLSPARRILFIHRHVKALVAKVYFWCK